MKSQIEILTELLDTISDSKDIVNSTALLENIAWEVNKYLQPSSLELLNTEQLKELFYSLVENYISSITKKFESSNIEDTINKMDNRPIGGRWIMILLSIGIWKIAGLFSIGVLI